MFGQGFKQCTKLLNSATIDPRTFKVVLHQVLLAPILRKDSTAKLNRCMSAFLLKKSHSLCSVENGWIYSNYKLGLFSTPDSDRKPRPGPQVLQDMNHLVTGGCLKWNRLAVQSSVIVYDLWLTAFGGQDPTKGSQTPDEWNHAPGLKKFQ